MKQQLKIKDMKMKSSMKLKAIMIITMLGMSLAGYAQAQKKDGTFVSESGMEMQVDSMVYSADLYLVALAGSGRGKGVMNWRQFCPQPFRSITMN